MVEGLSHVSDMNPVMFNTTPVSRALLRTGGGWTSAADRNQLAHTSSSSQKSTLPSSFAFSAEALGAKHRQPSCPTSQGVPGSLGA